MGALFVQVAYIAASAAFILGLRGLTKPDTARRGMQLAAMGMLLAVIGTLLNHQIISYDLIIIGLVIGTAIGLPMGLLVPMTAMPQRIAISHMFGALAVTLVGIAEFLHYRDVPGGPGVIKMVALGFETVFGALTITGSFMAFGKLQGFISGRPITFPGQKIINAAIFVGAIGLWIYLIATQSGGPAASGDNGILLFGLMTLLALVIGVTLVLPIGGADMPVVVSLLNSYAGLAASATGFAIGNNVLIVAGALDGASGFILSILMSKAMNRSFANVLFGAFGGEVAAASTKSSEGLTTRSVSAEDAAMRIGYARNVIIIPGYGMAVAQAQHAVRELAELIEKRGGRVRFAIHPVAGRMPGHMNVLLAEANVPYDHLFDLDEINEEFHACDVALVIGANDVTNPAAKTDPASPIYGMPILNVQEAEQVIVVKRGMATGFAGIENELFYLEKTSMLFGDAKSVLSQVVAEVKGLS
ncbi:MAG: NAD(P)(+) transhydrogenase (Re/Si-specific) subunit beta [Gemmatimonadota bacterium]|nr:NAD(P)(+) transhydrogenase (Re/Si-specific) subunit beta [Gemmatimonadota bacterium]